MWALRVYLCTCVVKCIEICMLGDTLQNPADVEQNLADVELYSAI